MSVMLSLLSWFLLVMAAGGGLHTNSATAEVTIASNSAAVTAYWHTMLPSTLMPSAILELLTPPADFEKENFKYGGPPTTDVEKDNFKYGGPPTTDVEKDNFKYGGPPTTEVQKDNFKYGRQPTTDVEKDNFKYGGSPTTDVEKDNFKYGGPHTTDVEKDNFKYGGPHTTNVEKDNFKYGGLPTTDVEKDNFKYGGPHTTDVEKDNFKYGGALTTEIGESHIGQYNHKPGTMSNNVFLEEALKPGSTITCYVLPSHTSGAPLLRRDVADTIPMSTRNFADIMAMFAPASNRMAAGIWSTLEKCEHPEPIKGEMKTCATSVESMVEFAASVLGVSTYNLHAFSSPDAPAEGIMPGRGYKVAAATRVTEAENTMTCHGGRFPFAVFMCHTLNPTRVYSVTLEGEDVGTGQRMEVLAVCHLDTSGFDPARMPLHVMPGDAPLCHFLSRDSIVWAPAAPASGHAAA